jgi:hypothetical protein
MGKEVRQNMMSLITYSLVRYIRIFIMLDFRHRNHKIIHSVHSYADHVGLANTGIVGSNPTKGMNVYVCCLVCM